MRVYPPLCPSDGTASCVRGCLKRTAGHLEPASSAYRWDWPLSSWVWRGMVSRFITQKNTAGATWCLDAGITWSPERKTQGLCARTGICPTKWQLHNMNSHDLVQNVEVKYVIVYLIMCICPAELLRVSTKSTVSRIAKNSHSIWKVHFQRISCFQTARCGQRSVYFICNLSFRFPVNDH